MAAILSVIGIGMAIPTEARAASPGFLSMIVTPDFSGDTKPDVLMVDTAGTLWIYKGDWSLRPGLPFIYPYERLSAPGVWTNFDLFAPGDFDADGCNDLVSRDRVWGQLYLYRGNCNAGNNGDSGIQEQILIGDGWANTQIAFGNFIGDSRPDMVGASPDGILRIYENTSARVNMRTQFPWSGYNQIDSGWQGSWLLPGGDLDQDGKSDIMSITHDGSLWLFRGLGNGTFAKVSQPISSGLITNYFITSGVDFDGLTTAGKKYPDLIRATPDGVLSLLPGMSGNRFGNPDLIGTGWYWYPVVRPPSMNIPVSGGTTAQQNAVRSYLQQWAGNSYIDHVEIVPKTDGDHFGETHLTCGTSGLATVMQLKSSMTGDQLKQVTAHEIGHAVSNYVYRDTKCGYMSGAAVTYFGNAEIMADCMAQAMTGLTTYLYNKPGGCSAELVNLARKVVNGQKI